MFGKPPKIVKKMDDRSTHIINRHLRPVKKSSYKAEASDVNNKEVVTAEFKLRKLSEYSTSFET